MLLDVCFCICHTHLHSKMVMRMSLKLEIVGVCFSVKSAQKVGFEAGADDVAIGFEIFVQQPLGIGTLQLNPVCAVEGPVGPRGWYLFRRHGCTAGRSIHEAMDALHCEAMCAVSRWVGRFHFFPAPYRKMSWIPWTSYLVTSTPSGHRYSAGKSNGSQWHHSTGCSSVDSLEFAWRWSAT